MARGRSEFARFSRSRPQQWHDSGNQVCPLTNFTKIVREKLTLYKYDIHITGDFLRHRSLSKQHPNDDSCSSWTPHGDLCFS